MPESTYRIPAVARATELMIRLCESETPLGVSELSRELGINKNMVFRLLFTLEAQGWVASEPGAKYRPSLEPFRHFSKPVHRIDAKRAAAQPLRRLWESTGEACYVAILEGQRCLFIDHLDSTREIRAQGRIGGRYALHCCAPGKVLLAYAGESLKARVLAAHLETNTPATIRTAEHLARELTDVKRSGYAVDLEEYCRGLMCFAAPIFDARGDVVATLGVSALTIHYTQAELRSVLGPQVLGAAADASKHLGAARVHANCSEKDTPCEP